MTAWETDIKKENIYRGELRRYPSKQVNLDKCQKDYEKIGFIMDPHLQSDRICTLPLGPEFNCDLIHGAAIGAKVEMDGERFVLFGQWQFAPYNCTFRTEVPALVMSMGYYLQWMLENIEP